MHSTCPVSHVVKLGDVGVVHSRVNILRIISECDIRECDHKGYFG
jgi:hypothetical protein